MADVPSWLPDLGPATFGSVDELPPDAQEAIQKGEAAEALLNSQGWKLICDELERLGDEALGELRNADAAEVLTKKLRWEIAEAVLLEIQLAILAHKELKDQLLSEQKRREPGTEPEPANPMTMGDSYA